MLDIPAVKVTNPSATSVMVVADSKGIPVKYDVGIVPIPKRLFPGRTLLGTPTELELSGLIPSALATGLGSPTTILCVWPIVLIK